MLPQSSSRDGRSRNYLSQSGMTQTPYLIRLSLYTRILVLVIKKLTEEKISLQKENPKTNNALKKKIAQRNITHSIL